ncbi:MAG: ArnT family glycosyltransferase [Vicinamibacterales bacterium]
MTTIEVPPLAWRDCVRIGLAALLPVLVLAPLQNAPFIDDWVYAWPVRHLLETGRLAVAEYSTSPQLAQTLWGALFSLPFGFSFAALRLSTWTMWAAMLCGVYLLVRELGGTRRNALVGASAVAVMPTGFVLAFSFMTDVPFLAGMVWSCFLFVQGLRRRLSSLIWMGVAAGCFATATRPIGLGLFAAMILTLLLHAGSWGRRRATLAAPVAGLVFAAAILALGRMPLLQSADMSGVENAPVNRIASLPDAVAMLPTTLPLTIVFLVSAVGLALLPLAVASVSRTTARRALPLAAGGVVAWSLLRYLEIGYWVPLSFCETWSLYELGMAKCLTPHAAQVSLPLAFEVMLSTVALTCGSLVVSSTLERGGGGRHPFLWWLIVIELGLSALLWLYHFDRYALPFALLIAVMVMARGVDVTSRPALVAVGLYAAVAVIGLRDHLEFNRTLWEAVDRLRAARVPAADIDAGYVVNGWLQYTRPDEAHRNAEGAISIPMVNSVDRLPYTVANQPRAGAVVRESLPYAGWLYPDGRLFVLWQETLE